MQVVMAVVGPCNIVLFVHSPPERTNVFIMMDNEALYDICRRSLDAERPIYTNSQRLLDQRGSSLPSSPQFDEMSQFQTAMVLHPYIHCMLSSLALVTSAAKTFQLVGWCPKGGITDQPPTVVAECCKLT